MRGQKVNKESRRLDIVLVAARYAEDGVLEFARGYERRGDVWTDVRIYDRQTLLQKARSGALIFTGEPVTMPGNFEPAHRVRVEGQNGDTRLVANGGGSPKDDLGLPVL